MRVGEKLRLPRRLRLLAMTNGFEIASVASPRNDCKMDVTASDQRECGSLVVVFEIASAKASQ